MIYVKLCPHHTVWDSVAHHRGVLSHLGFLFPLVTLPGSQKFPVLSSFNLSCFSFVLRWHQVKVSIGCCRLNISDSWEIEFYIGAGEGRLLHEGAGGEDGSCQD